MSHDGILGRIAALALVAAALAIVVGPASSAAGPTTVTAPKKILLTLYYESLCPYSKLFVTNQLLPNYEHIQDHVDVVLVPYGKAISSIDNTTGAVRFECQHGQPECHLNMLESCALFLLNGRPFAEKLAYVGCEMRVTPAHDAADLECPDEAGVSRGEMRACLTGGLGVQLQLEAERHTHRVRVPYPEGIPTVTFDDRYDIEQSRRATADLAAELCRLNAELCRADTGDHVDDNSVLE